MNGEVKFLWKFKKKKKLGGGGGVRLRGGGNINFPTKNSKYPDLGSRMYHMYVS